MSIKATPKTIAAVSYSYQEDEPVEESILLEAASLVAGDRQADYGTAEENWSRTAEIASAICGLDLSPETCVKVLIATKLARLLTSPHKRDHYVDLAGYAHILRQVVK